MLNSWGVDESDSDSGSYEEFIIPYNVMTKFYDEEKLYQGSSNDEWLCGYNYVEAGDVSLVDTSADEFSTKINKKINLF